MRVTRLRTRCSHSACIVQQLDVQVILQLETQVDLVCEEPLEPNATYFVILHYGAVVLFQGDKEQTSASLGNGRAVPPRSSRLHQPVHQRTSPRALRVPRARVPKSSPWAQLHQPLREASDAADHAAVVHRFMQPFVADKRAFTSDFVDVCTLKPFPCLPMLAGLHGALVWHRCSCQDMYRSFPELVYCATPLQQ